MNHIPTYLWVITYGKITSIAAATAYLTRPLLWFTLLGITDLVSALTLGALTGFLQIVRVNPPATLNADLPLAIIPTVGVPLLLAMHLTSLRLLLQGRAADRVSDELVAHDQTTRRSARPTIYR
jgi:hypothetical protein